MREDETDELLGADGLRRTAALIASGVDPRGYHVSAKRLREVIQASPASRSTRRAVLAHLERSVLRGAPETVDCYLLGMAMARLPNAIPTAQVRLVHDEIRDLNKLPFVSIKGEPVS